MDEFLGTLLMIALLGACVMMWRRVLIANKNSQPHFLSPRATEITPLGFADVFAAFIITIAAQTFAATLAMLVTGIRDFDLANVEHMTVINIAFGTAQFFGAGLILLYLYNRYRSVEATGWKPGFFKQDLKLGCYGFLLFVPPMLLLQSVLTNFWEYEHPTLEMVNSDSPLLSIVSAWWAATIVAPVTEEILFRVVLLGWLIRCFANPRDFAGGFLGGIGKNAVLQPATVPVADYSEPVSDAIEPEVINPYTSPSSSTNVSSVEFRQQKTWAPVFIVALLFALAHIQQGPAPIPIFFLGLGLCYMYRQTGSVVPCIVTHFLLNAFSMTLLTIQQFCFPAEEVLPDPVSYMQIFMP